MQSTLSISIPILIWNGDIFKKFFVILDWLQIGCIFIRGKGTFFALKALWHKTDCLTQTANDLTYDEEKIRVLSYLMSFWFFCWLAKMQTIFQTKMWGGNTKIFNLPKSFLLIQWRVCGVSSTKRGSKMFWQHITVTHFASISRYTYIYQYDLAHKWLNKSVLNWLNKLICIQFLIEKEISP